MDGFLIINGGYPLIGSVEISKSKNAALPIMAAAAFGDKNSLIKDIPKINDCKVMQQIIDSDIEEGGSKLSCLYKCREIRSSYYLIAPMLYRNEYAIIEPPGGCSLNRTFSGVMKCVEKFGFSIEYEYKMNSILDRIIVRKSSKPLPDKVNIDCRLKIGNRKFSSVGITMNAILMSKLVKQTTIKFPANDPEVHCLLDVMALMGAEIEKTQNRFFIKSEEKASNFHYSLPPDRIEAGTYALAALITGGSIVIKNYPFFHLEKFTETLEKMGAELHYEKTDIGPLYVRSGGGPCCIKSIVCDNYPEFPTDLHPLIAVWAGLKCDNFQIEDRIYGADRFEYVKMLQQLGLDASVHDNILNIKKVDKYHLDLNYLSAPDLRGGMAIFLALLTLSQRKSFYGERVLERGYENYITKFRELGAKIQHGHT